MAESKMKPSPFSKPSPFAKSTTNVRVATTVSKPSPFSSATTTAATVSKPSPFKSTVTATTATTIATTVSKPSPFKSTVTGTKISTISPAKLSTSTSITVPSTNKIIISRKLPSVIPKAVTSWAECETVDDIISLLRKRNSANDLIDALYKLYSFNLPTPDYTTKKPYTTILNIYQLIYPLLATLTTSELLDLLRITATVIEILNYNTEIMKIWDKSLQLFKSKVSTLSEYQTVEINYIFGLTWILPDPDFINLINTGVRTYLDRFPANILAIILYSYFRSGYQPEPDMLTAIYEQVEQKYKQLDLKSTFYVLYSSEMLNHLLTKETIAKLLNVIERWNHKPLGADANLAGDILYVLRFYDYNPGDEILTLITEMMDSTMLKPLIIGFFLVSLGHFDYDIQQYPHYQDLLHKFYNILVEHELVIHFRTCLDILEGLYFLNILDTALLDLIADILYGLMNYNSYVEYGTGTYNLADLVMILRTYSFFEIRPRNKLLKLILDHIVGYHKDITPLRLKHIVISLANLNYDPGYDYMAKLASYSQDKELTSYFQQLGYSDFPIADDSQIADELEKLKL